jgi:Flp pilus assembly protein TadD
LCAQRTGDAESAAKYFDEAQNLRPDSWIPSFNLACLKAIAGDADAALALLESALEKETGGSALLQALQSDPDLASLRDRADFKTLIHQAQAAIAATS